MSAKGWPADPADVDQAEANAERVRDFAAAGHVSQDYGRGYADSLEDQRIAAESVAVLRAERRAAMYRSAVRNGVLYGAAYGLGLLLGDWLDRRFLP